MKLYYNPLSAYSQKVLVAFYEKGLEFDREFVDMTDAAKREEFRKVTPIGKVPFLRIEGKDWGVPESSIIIEYVDLHCKGPRLIPEDPDLARQVRFRDRIMDQYVNDPMTKIMFDARRPEGSRDPLGVKQAQDRLDRTLAMLDETFAKSTWAMGETFSMADCAAAPALNYARMVHPVDKYKHVMAYLQRLSERPSFARVLKEAEPYIAAFKG